MLVKLPEAFLNHGEDDPPWPALGGVSTLAVGESTAEYGEMLMVTLIVDGIQATWYA